MNNLITIENGTALLSAETASKIADFERTIKSLKEQEETLKQAILEAMEANNILKIDMKDLLISYVAATEKETFDSKALRNDDPDLYDAYIKMAPVKSSIRIKVR